VDQIIRPFDQNYPKGIDSPKKKAKLHLNPSSGPSEMLLKEIRRKPMERLVRHASGHRPTPETLDRLARLSERKSFYLEELMRFTAEGREGPLPETLVAMMQSRLGTLEELHWRVLLVKLLGRAELRYI
jgi:hypothetical protein